jgi:DNA-binding MarR family transcriptional regulator
MLMERIRGSRSGAVLKVLLDIIIYVCIIKTMMIEYMRNQRTVELMGQIVSGARRLVESRLKVVGLTFPQFGTLFVLAKHGGNRLSQRELADLMETDTTTIMVVCDSLEQKGMLTRSPDPSDRRINRVAATKKGKNVVDKALPSVLEVFRPLLSGISEKESDALSSILEKMRGVVKSLEDARRDSP